MGEESKLVFLKNKKKDRFFAQKFMKVEVFYARKIALAVSRLAEISQHFSRSKICPVIKEGEIKTISKALLDKLIGIAVVAVSGILCAIIDHLTKEED